ncbi:peptidase S13 [Desulfopila sp. IMCC35006]|uniref:D-alanyl-D-alanine carboxypeptidase/D-alanyl-D-alanine-endopeptidase n=1 Tax=Desulfopila sp. IMCC35006 TaxID=2569542 RepID=UPI0010AC52AD|nr:D-alanyl-D-alanine carboxypeptidase [Desulfopila sp. IMCC35006]TKB28167.1 peptidase S13 [Desulfopila sp. IMCC35006]
MMHSAQKKISGKRLCCCLLGLMLLLEPFRAGATSEIERIIDNGGYIVHGGTTFLKFKEQNLFIPASTLKILTCLVGLKNLGREYRFETHFFLDKKNNLYIKGYGDPLLTSEVVREIGHTLAGMGIRSLAAVYLDTSSFALKGETAAEENSDNPYDAPNGALVVNFNALPIKIARDQTITSGEPQTPVIPLMAQAAKQLAPGMHRINVNTLLSEGQRTPALRYTGELFVVLLREAGITVPGYNIKPVPPNLQPIYIHRGEKSLEEIIRVCLKNSNNFIANQIFLACGVKTYGLPATWEKSRQVFAAFTQKTLQLGPDKIIVKEGSGLSRQNRMSPAALLAILDLFKPYSTLLKRQNDILLKSGTMKDIYCYAGYFPKGDDLIPFAILLNQPNNNRSRVLEILHAAVSQQGSH